MKISFTNNVSGNKYQALHIPHDHFDQEQKEKKWNRNLSRNTAGAAVQEP